MKYRVRKGHTLYYPDGTVRGHRGYVISALVPDERATLERQGDALEPTERQAQPDAYDAEKLAQEYGEAPAVPAADDWGGLENEIMSLLDEIMPDEEEEKPKAKKKASKKKATKKKGILDRFKKGDD